MKYTIKELTSIAGTHDPYHCHEEDCNICIRFWTYAKGLREQDKEDESRKIKRVVPKHKKASLEKLNKIKTSDIRKLVKEWSAELKQAIDQGCSVREIAFQLDCDDALVVEALDYLRIKPKTRTELRLEAYRSELANLVTEGYSTQAIANLLGKKSGQGIAQYLKKYEVPRPNSDKVIIEQIEYQYGGELKHRYFNENGDEVEIKVIKGASNE
ncbi:hypothetical protein [Pediococcus pentosaceus]